ncbi:MAG TPA: Tsi3 family protein [Longimicrobiaceae bacterium]
MSRYRGSVSNPIFHWRTHLWIAGFAALAACLSPDPEQTVRHRHPNGLSLDLPESLVVERTPDGFRVRPPSAGNAVRNPAEVVASLRPDAARPGDGRWSTRRGVRYRVLEDEGGSGGTGYRLEAWKEHVRFEQYTQREGGAPDFALAWRVIGGSRVER